MNLPFVYVENDVLLYIFSKVKRWPTTISVCPSFIAALLHGKESIKLVFSWKERKEKKKTAFASMGAFLNPKLKKTRETTEHHWFGELSKPLCLCKELFDTKMWSNKDKTILKKAKTHRIWLNFLAWPRSQRDCYYLFILLIVQLIAIV